MTAAVTLGIVMLIEIAVTVWLNTRTPQRPPAVQARSTQETHALRRQIDLAQFSAETRNDAARLRRELRRELKDLDDHDHHDHHDHHDQ